jgi:ABC-type dipeptide/oligopeptide/nickel transport system permease component
MRVSGLLFGVLRYSAVMVGTALLLHALPGSPWSDLEHLPLEVQESLARHLGCLDPLPIKVGRSTLAAFTWQFGPSLSYPDWTCQAIVLRAWPLSLLIGLWTLLAAWPLSWITACWLASSPLRMRWGRVALSLLLSCPPFLTVGVAIWRGWATPLAPPVQQVALAVCCLFWIPFAQSSFYLSRALERELKEPYLLHALLRGESPAAALFRHGLLPALGRLTSFLAPQAAALLTGSAAVEKALSIPGLGAWFVDSVLQRDASMILALTAAFTCTLLLCSALAEQLRGRLDPRPEYPLVGGSR